MSPGYDPAGLIMAPLWLAAATGGAREVKRALLAATGKGRFNRMRAILSFDAETNGLWGEAFAIGAILLDAQGREAARFLGRLSDAVVTDEWVRAHVLPALAAVPVTHLTYLDLLRDFATFYLSHRHAADVIVHIGVPVEARLLLDAHAAGLIADDEAPFPLIDVAGFLAQAGEDPTSVDLYANAHAVPRGEFDGAPHHPLFDAAATAAVYRHLLSRRAR